MKIHIYLLYFLAYIFSSAAHTEVIQTSNDKQIRTTETEKKIKKALLRQYHHHPHHKGQFHTGNIEEDGENLKWTNQEGTSWSLIPDLVNKRLLTDESSPFYNEELGQSFELVTEKKPNGTLIVKGFNYLGEFYYVIGKAINIDDVDDMDYTFENGAELYEEYCSACHGELASSKKKGSTVKSIKKAWKTSPMNVIEGKLSDEELTEIQIVLADPNQDSADNSTGPDEGTITEQDPNALCEIDWKNINNISELSCLKSRDELLKSVKKQLPDRNHKNGADRVMMRQTESNQRASIEYPRVIMFNAWKTSKIPDEGFRFALGFETFPDSTSVEVAIFDNKANIWNFAGLEFEDAGLKIERETCKVCHGSGDNQHPIWQGYNVWPGAFADRNNLKQEELQFLQDLKDGKYSQHPIFKYINKHKNYKLGKELRGNENLIWLIMGNASKKFVARVQEKQSLSQKDKLKLAYKMACQRKYSATKATMSELGFNYADFFEFNKPGNPKPQTNMWTGGFPIQFFAGVQLFRALVTEDASLRDIYPELYNSSVNGVSNFFGKYYQVKMSPDFSCAALKANVDS